MTGEALDRNPSTLSGPLPPTHTVAPKFRKSCACVAGWLTAICHAGNATRSGSADSGGWGKGPTACGRWLCPPATGGPCPVMEAAPRDRAALGPLDHGDLDGGRGVTGPDVEQPGVGGGDGPGYLVLAQREPDLGPVHVGRPAALHPPRHAQRERDGGALCRIRGGRRARRGDPFGGVGVGARRDRPPA